MSLNDTGTIPQMAGPVPPLLGTQVLEPHDMLSTTQQWKKSLWVSLGISLFIFGISFLLYLSFSYMGARNKEIEEIIFNNFKMLLMWINLKILLVYIVVGLIIGLFTVLLKIERKRYIGLFNLFIWFMFWIRAIKLYPQMFSEQLYRKGGLLKYFQVLITDYTPLFLIYGLFVVSILAIGYLKKRIRYSILLLGLSMLLIVRFGVTTIDAGVPVQSQPNILIFATDSLRPDHLSYNGYHRKTPAADSILSKGANFLNLKSSLARTLPSWTTVFTSTYPPDHKMRHMFPDKEGLKKNWPTFVDVLNQNNYHSSVISDFAGDIFPSIDYGFDKVVSPEISVPEVLKQRSQEIHYFLAGFLVNPVGRYLFPEMWGMTLNKDPWYVTKYTKIAIKDAVKQKKPFFILSFSSNNHFPYITKYPYYDMYTPNNYMGDHKYGLGHDVLETFLEAPVSKAGITQIVNLYDSAVKLYDDNLGEILSYLKRCNLDKNTIVIIMSDHGESLHEEDYGLAHGDHLLGAFANTMTFGVYSPLMDLGGRRIKGTARDIDIAPTILDLVNLPSPKEFRGVSLLPAMKGEPFDGLPIYLETGIWYTPTTPFILNKERYPYPPIINMVEIIMPSGKIAVKDEFESLIIRAKHKGFQLNEKKYIFMPGVSDYKEFFFINDRLVKKEDIRDPEFLTYKQKIVDLFKGKFYIDETGYLHEKLK